jgi:O-antigen/teichoic acid export membrane protein
MKEKFKELTKDTAVYGVSTILSRFLNFILVPFYSHYLAPSEYGIVTTVYAYIAFLTIVYLYGIDSAYLKYASKSENNDPKTIFSNSFNLIFISSLAVSALLFLLRVHVNNFMELPIEYSSVTIYSIIILFLDALTAVPFAYLRINRYARKFAALKTLNILINVTLNMILIIKYRMGIEAIFISNLAASVITFLFLVPVIIRNLKINLQREVLIKLLKFGIPYLPAGLASMVIQVIDRPILLQLTDESTVGVYQANYRLGIFMMLFVSMFQYAWQPFFLNNAKEENAKEIFSKVLTYFILAGSFVLVFLSLFISDIVKFQILGKTIINSRYWGGLNIVPIVLLGYLFNGIYYNFTAGIFIEEKTKYVPYITGLGALINIIVNYLMIPHWGMTGAAFATLASYIVMALVLYIISQKFYKIRYEFGKILRIFIVLTIVSVLYYTFAEGRFYLEILLFMIFLLLISLSGVINLREVKSLKTVLRPRVRSGVIK